MCWAPGLCISHSMLDPVKTRWGSVPRRIGEASVYTPNANPMTATLPAMDIQPSASLNGVRSVSGTPRVATTRIACRTKTNVTIPR